MSISEIVEIQFSTRALSRTKNVAAKQGMARPCPYDSGFLANGTFAQRNIYKNVFAVSGLQHAYDVNGTVPERQYDLQSRDRESFNLGGISKGLVSNDKRVPSGTVITPNESCC
jgi:hypothetical protein